MKSVGDRIQEQLEKSNLTQKELAEKVNVQEATISRYVNNERQPRSDILSRIAYVLNVTSDHLLGRPDEMNISYTDKINKANSLKDELIELMINRGIIKDRANVNEDHLKLIEMSISTYADKTNNKKQGDEN